MENERSDEMEVDADRTEIEEICYQYLCQVFPVSVSI